MKLCRQGHEVIGRDGGGCCITCKRAANRADYHRNKEKRLAVVTAYNLAHRTEKCAYSKDYISKPKNALARRIYKNTRYANDPLYQAIHKMRQHNLRIRRLTGQRKITTVEKEVGYSFKEYHAHMLSTKPEGLEYFECAHDHIIPISYLLAVGITSIAIINSLDNFQLLSKKDNSEKHALVDLSLAKGVVFKALQEKGIL